MQKVVMAGPRSKQAPERILRMVHHIWPVNFQMKIALWVCLLELPLLDPWRRWTVGYLKTSTTMWEFIYAISFYWLLDIQLHLLMSTTACSLTVDWPSPRYVISSLTKALMLRQSLACGETCPVQFLKMIFWQLSGIRANGPRAVIHCNPSDIGCCLGSDLGMIFSFV